MSKITVPLSATGTELICEDPDVRILSKTVGVYYIKLTLDAYWTDGEENILLVMKKKNENLSTVLEYSVGEVRSGADKEIPTALLETEGKISVWVGKTPSSGEQMLSGVLELTVEPSGGIIEEGDICVKTPLSENAVEKVRQVNGVFQYNASHGWKALAGQTEVNEELEKKVDKIEGKGLSANDYTDGDKQTVNDTLPHAIGVNSQAIAILNDKKVDKIEGKGLSTNDFTDEDKAEVAKVASKADISNPLSLPDNLLPVSGLLKHYYTPAGSTPGTGGTHNYSVSEIDQISLTEDVPKAVSKIPSSYAVAQYVQSSVSNKVDKVEGKDLSTNDYTNDDKQLVNEVLPASVNENAAAIEAIRSQKVDKVEGKGLSTNDFTTELKDKLDGVETGANKTVVDETLSATSENPVQNKAVKAALDKKIDEPTTNGLVRKWMSGIYTTIGVDTTMPTSPTDNSVPTTKLLKDYVEDNTSNPLKLSDANLQKTGLIAQSYTPAGSTPGTVGTTTYFVRQIDINSLSESGLDAYNIPTSKAVISWVKAYIESLNLNGGA